MEMFTYNLHIFTHQELSKTQREKNDFVIWVQIFDRVTEFGLGELLKRNKEKVPKHEFVQHLWNNLQTKQVHY